MKAQTPGPISRRELLAAPLLARALTAQTAAPTVFQIACMTLPYSPFPMERALTGIQRSGYKYVAWGTSHRDASGTVRPVLAVDAPAAESVQLANRCRGLGLEPVMMFAT